MEKFKIGLMGSAFFVGWTICSLGQRLGDIYGRKGITVISMVASIIIYAALMISTNLYLTIFLFFVFGLTVGKSMIGYVYLLDFIPNKNKALIGTIVLVCDAMTQIILSGYFRFISKDWIWIHIAGISVLTVATIGAFFLPESPQFYYCKGDFHNAEKIVKMIAKVNGKNSILSLKGNISISVYPRH